MAFLLKMSEKGLQGWLILGFILLLFPWLNSFNYSRALNFISVIGLILITLILAHTSK